jgi:hypothetical protein
VNDGSEKPIFEDDPGKNNETKIYIRHEITVVRQVSNRDLRLQSVTQLGDSERRHQFGTRPLIGEIVEVRSADEILATLDEEGKLEGVPFMPEMLSFCGHTFLVVKYADNTCTDGKPRCLANTVHLDELRCDGSAHCNCQAKCLLFWKEAWIKRVAPQNTTGIKKDGLHARNISGLNSATALLSAHVERNDGTMSCQATELKSATCPLDLSLAQYVGNTCRDFLAEKIDWPDLRRLLRWMRHKLIWSAFVWWARAPWNSKQYVKTPSRTLDLQQGDLVKVRRTCEILRTLDRNGFNRGLRFTPEMFRYCGQKCRVLSKLERRINEIDGQLVEFGNPCILLENVICEGQRIFCSRSEYHYWREIWLERC